MDRIPPHDIEAEQQVLGCCLMNKPEQVVSALEEKDFYQGAHRKIFLAIQSLFQSGKPVDKITVSSSMTQEILAEIGGSYYLAELTNAVITTSRIAEYVAIVKEKSILRQLIECGYELTDRAFEALESGRDIINDIAPRMLKMIFEKSGFKKLSEVIPEGLELIQNADKNYLPSFAILKDRFMPRKTDLVILASHPRVGKTAMLWNLSREFGKRAPGGIFSMEMSNAQMAMRAVKLSTKHGTVAALDWPVWINDTILSPTDMRAQATELIAKHQIEWFIFDYMRLARTESKEGETHRVNTIAEEIKEIAKTTDTTWIALHHLSREDMKGKREPVLSDLMYGGGHAADTVLFLHPLEQDKEGNILRVKLICAKQRNGPSFVEEFNYFGERFEFLPAEKNERNGRAAYEQTSRVIGERDEEYQKETDLPF